MNDGQPLIERPDNRAAAILRKMADHIDRNKEAGFGGCVVIVPPENGGSPIEMLILEQIADIGQFYANVSARIQARVLEVQDIQKMQQGFGRR